MYFSESGMLNLQVKLVLFHKVATFDKTHTFNNTFVKCSTVSPTETLYKRCTISLTTTLLSNIALFCLQQQFSKIALFYILQHYTKYCLFMDSKYKLSTTTLYNCLFLNKNNNFHFYIFLPFCNTFNIIVYNFKQI